MASEQRGSFLFVKTVLYYTGVTPNKPGEAPTTFNRLRRAIPLLAAAYSFYCIIILLISIYQKQDDVENVSFFVGGIFFRIVIGSKFGTVYLQEARLADLIQEIETLFNDLVRGDDLKIKKGMRFMRVVQMLGLLFWITVALLMLMQVPKMYATRSMHSFHYHPYDITKSPMFDITIMAYMLFSILGFGYIVMVDVVFLVTEVHLIAIARSLSNRILQIRASAEKSIEGLRIVRRACTFAESLTLQHDGELEEAPARSNMQVQGGWRKIRQVVESRGREVAGGGGLETVALAVGRKEEVNTAMELILAKCVEQHERFIKLFEEVNDLIKMASVVQLMLNILVGLMVLYVTTLAEKFGSLEVFVLCLSFGLYLELLVVCILGDVMTKQSLQVGVAAYSCDWLEASARFKHALRMIISRSQRELCIKAAGIPLSLRTFRTIGRAGYYLHMLISNFYHGVKIVGQRQ